MKSQTDNFSAKDSDTTREPRFVVALSFDDANTDITYFTSHADAAVPGGTAAIDIIHSSIMPRGISGLSQKIEPDKAQHTIGNITLRLLDVDGKLTTKIKTKLDGGESLRKKRVKIYIGHQSSVWADYAERLTYLVEDLDSKDGVYTIRTADIQREERKTIFEPDQGVLTSTIDSDVTTIPITTASALTKFITIEHDAIYGADPSQTVGYIKIDDEIIKHVGINGGGTAFEGCTRGALNTNNVEHTVTASEAEKKKKIDEYFYLEMAAPRMIYAILTGVIDGQTGDLPDHWNLGIDTAFARLSDFQDIGIDFWDTSNNKGRIARFIGLQRVEGKKFIEKELLLWLGAFMPVYSDGALGLKRFQSVLPYSSYTAYLNESEVTKYNPLVYKMDKVINNIAIKWNWVEVIDRFTKINQLIDSNSISKHGKAPLKIYEFEGVFTGVHSDNDVNNYFGIIKDRYANPPLSLRIETLPEWNKLDVGDTVRVDLNQVVDYHIDQPLDRVFEIQQMTTDWVTGRVSLDLFGGIEKSSIDVLSSTDVLLDSYYTTGGTELSTVLTIVGGVVTVSGTLTGAALNTSAIFYYDGNLEIGAGVVVTCTSNVMLRVKGFLTINGDITVTGTLAQTGVIGSTTTGRPCHLENVGPYGLHYWLISGRKVNTGLFSELPTYDLINEDGTGIEGVPDSLLGVSGSTGGNATIEDTSGPVGGAGGAGGGGLVIVCRGAAIGGSGHLDSSGEDGTLGASKGFHQTITWAQTGSGGAAGGILFLIDGNYSTPTFTSSNTSAVNGLTETPSGITKFAKAERQVMPISQVLYGEAITTTFNEFNSLIRTQFIPPPIEPFVWLPSDEENEAVGYGNPPPDWEEIEDANGTIPEDNATAGAVGIFLPLIQSGVGSTDIEVVKNAEDDGTPNDGEIQFKAGTYLLPTGQQRVLTTNKDWYTPYEGAIVPPDDVFYVIWGASDVSTRFSTLVGIIGTAEADGIFTAIFNRATGQWSAVDNDNNLEDFDPLDTDYAFAIGYKTSITGGIDQLTQSVARVFDQKEIRNDQVVTAQLGAINENPGFEVPRLGPTGFPAPSSWFGYGSTDAIRYLDDATQDIVQIAINSSLNIAGAAMPVNVNTTYRFIVLAKYSGSGSPTLALNIHELDADMNTEERVIATHSGAGADDIALFRTQTRSVLALSATALTAFYAVYEGLYDPTDTAKWFSPKFTIAGNGTASVELEWAVVANNADVTSIEDKPDAGIIDGSEFVLLSDAGDLLSFTLEDLFSFMSRPGPPAPIFNAPWKTSLAFDGKGEIEFTRAGIATYVDRYGNVRTAVVDEPRFEKEGLLIEGESENLCLRSQEFNNVVWEDPSANWTPTANTGTAPDGTTTADNITALSTVAIIRQDLTAATGSSFSVWAQIVSGTISEFEIDHGDGTFIDVASQLSGSNWVRLKAENLIKGVSDWVDMRIVGSSGFVVRLWGAQFEELPFCTSYIHTQATAVTRALEKVEADSILTPGESQILPGRSEPYSMIVDVDILGVHPTDDQYIMREAARIIFLAAFNNGGNGEVYYSDFSGLNDFPSSLVPNQITRIGVSLGAPGDSTAGYLDGILDESNTRGSPSFSGLRSTVAIGYQETGGGSNHLFGHLSNFRIYPAALTRRQMGDT